MKPEGPPQGMALRFPDKSPDAKKLRGGPLLARRTKMPAL